MRALFTSATGMAAQQLKLDGIAHNLANVNTTAYKRGREDFQDLFYQTIKATGGSTGTGESSPTGINLGCGVRTASVEKLFTQGSFVETKGTLDLAIEGDGFFALETSAGDTVYTRAGNFKKNADGEIVNTDGYKLKPGFAIPSDATSVSVSTDGTISIMTAGSVEPTTIGTLELTRFVNPGGLQPLGRNLYKATDSSGSGQISTPGEEGTGSIVQGFLEASNVDIAEEMVQLIVAQRAYETNSKVMSAADQMLQKVNNILR